ncbi:uncharacterized protein LOC123878568 isoform X2 [Maniola jurtina]|uniref:uncharacterized protein LOC123878568 isoform X2 n=1 Tax=Maniola jurtina TaxID=191418 RepID=UPI001E68B9EB|nr:uncharacterized protein LOC123878568 isoform X2 [Maniola jurtina]
MGTRGSFLYGHARGTLNAVYTLMDVESHKQWEIQMSHLAPDEMPTWSQLAEFLEARFRALEMIDTNKAKHPVQSNQASKPKSFHTTLDNQNKKEPVCALCEENHHLYACKKFGVQQPKERQDFVQAKGLCFNCLAPFHSVKNCRLAKSCQKCGRKHHTLLHFNKEARDQEGFLSTTENLHLDTNNSEKHAQSSTSLGTETRIISNFAKEKLQPNEVLLATALVKTRAKNGCEHHIRALLDQGSQASFITEATIQLLGLKRSPVNAWVSGLGPGGTRVKYMVSLHVESRQNPEKSIQVDAYVLRSFSWVLPSSNLTSPDCLEFGDLVLADPGYATSSKIDLLLGAEVYSKILTEGMIKHPKGNLIAQNTIFGWTISGEVSNDTNAHSKRVVNMHLKIRVENKRKQFPKIGTELNNNYHKNLIREEIKSGNLSTAMSANDGRYVVLPLEKETPDYEEKQFKALKRSHSIERKLKKNSNYYEEDQKIQEEDITLNSNIELIENNKETKDSAAEIVHQHAEIREDKMYDQVKVHERDTKYQRLLWKHNSFQPVQHYKLLTSKFATVGEPYLDKRYSEQITKDEEHNFAIAVEKGLEIKFNVDNLMATHGSREEVVEGVIYIEMSKLLRVLENHFQKLHAVNLEWDDTIITKEQVRMKIFKILRKIQLIDSFSRELHASNDTSKSAHATGDQIHMSSITANIKVTSIQKKLTTVRLKLCDRFLVAKLIYELVRILNVFKYYDLHVWSDSGVILTWLKGLPNYCTNFMNNRVSEIINIIEYKQRTKDHIIYPNKPDVSTHKAEKTSKNLAEAETRKETENELLSTKILILPRELFTLTKKKKEKRNKLKVPITIDEMKISLPNYLKKSEEIEVYEGLNKILKRGYVRKKSTIYPLHSFIDEKTLLRATKSITFLKVRYDKRHLIKLIVEDTHEKTLHNKPQMILDLSHEKYWFI